MRAVRDQTSRAEIAAMIDRIVYAIIAAAWGAVIGAACWWLYGLAHSLQYQGPGIDPSLLHWVKPFGLAFATIGFILGEKVGDVLGHLIGALFNFELGHHQTALTAWHVIVVVAAIGALIWFQSSHMK
jgi:hypothetical protein